MKEYFSLPTYYDTRPERACMQELRAEIAKAKEEERQRAQTALEAEIDRRIPQMTNGELATYLETFIRSSVDAAENDSGYGWGQTVAPYYEQRAVIAEIAKRLRTPDA